MFECYNDYCLSVKDIEVFDEIVIKFVVSLENLNSQCIGNYINI